MESAKPSRLRNLGIKLGLASALLTGSNTNNQAHAEQTTPLSQTNAMDISYGIRHEIQRQYGEFGVQAKLGLFLPQNTGSVSENISNLDFFIDINSFESVPMYLTGSLNLIFSDAGQLRRDEFDFNNEIRLGFTISPISNDIFALSGEAAYWDQTNFDPELSNQEHSGAIGVRATLDPQSWLHLEASYQQYFLNNLDLPEDQHLRSFRAGLQLNATEFNFKFPFGLVLDYINTTSEITAEPNNSFMVSLVVLTPNVDYKTDISYHHPVLGTSYAFTRTDKQKVENPDEKREPQDECLSLEQSILSVVDLTLTGKIDSKTIQRQLKCNKSITYKLGLDQVKEFKQAVGQWTNFALNIGKSLSEGKQTGQALYQSLKEIPTTGQIKLDTMLDSLAKFLVLTDQSLSHLHSMDAVRLSDLEKRFSSGITAAAKHYFDPSKGTHLIGEFLKYGQEASELIHTSQIAIQNSGIYQFTDQAAHSHHHLIKTLEFVAQVSKDIGLNIPFQQPGIDQQTNSLHNYKVTEMIRQFETILQQGIKLNLHHHNSVEIVGYDDPIIEGINIQNISSHGKMHLTKLSDYNSSIEILEDQIIIVFTMVTDATNTPPTYKLTFNKTHSHNHQH